MTYNVVRVSLTMLLIVAQRKRVVYSAKPTGEFADSAVRFLITVKL